MTGHIYHAVCRRMLKNPAVMNPLVRFLVVNAAWQPVTDLEWVAAQSGRNLFTNLINASSGTVRKIRTDIIRDWTNAR